MSVTDSLVGRVIGLGGNKINSITVSVLCVCVCAVDLYSIFV